MGHALGVANRVALNVAQLVIAARLVEVGRLAYHHLTHLVEEEALFAGEQPQNGPSLHALPLNELAKVHLFVKARLRLVEQLLVLRLAREPRTEETHLFYRLEIFEVSLYAANELLILDVLSGFEFTKEGGVFGLTFPFLFFIFFSYRLLKVIAFSVKEEVGEER